MVNWVKIRVKRHIYLSTSYMLKKHSSQEWVVYFRLKSFNAWGEIEREPLPPLPPPTPQQYSWTVASRAGRGMNDLPFPSHVTSWPCDLGLARGCRKWVGALGELGARYCNRETSVWIRVVLEITFLLRKQWFKQIQDGSYLSLF